MNTKAKLVALALYLAFSLGVLIPAWRLGPFAFGEYVGQLTVGLVPYMLALWIASAIVKRWHRKAA